MRTPRAGRSYTFTHTISRRPGAAVVKGLRATDVGDPDPAAFDSEFDGYLQALASAGVETMVLDPLDGHPDAVFVEDAAICVGRTAIATRPGAPSRFGEVAALRPTLAAVFDEVRDLDTDGFVEGGDVLLGDSEAWIGLSERTDDAGFDALAAVLSDYGYRSRRVVTPPGVLHFKTDCALLDSETVFCTPRLAASGCFEGYRVLFSPDGEAAAANLIRVNDLVLVRSGFERTAGLLAEAGFDIALVSADEAAKVDGGLSCMSLRFDLSP